MQQHTDIAILAQHTSISLNGDQYRDAFVLTAPEPLSAPDNDCACPEAPFRCATTTGTDGHFVRRPDLLLRDLPGGFTLAFSPLAPAGPCVLSPAALQRLEQFEQAQPLSQPVDADLATQQLIQPEQGQPAPETGPPTTLTVWMHITNACNLDCPYCYVRKSSARMSEQVGLQALQQIVESARLHGFSHVKLKYAGGEASLHMRLVRLLHERARHLTAQARLGLRAVLLSNGVALRPADADWLVEQQVKLMVSLDAIGAAHDAQRPMRNGMGSFARIEQTVDHVLLPRGIRPDITVTITRSSAPYAAGAVRWALERDLPVSLNFYRPSALSASRTDLLLEEQAIIEGMRSAYRVIEEFVPLQPLLGGLLDRIQANQAHTHTCGVGLAYLVMTHEGKLAQCQMHLSDATVLPDAHDPIRLVASGPIRNLPVEQKEGCRDCKYRYRCTGGCPIETFRATGRWDIASPHCHIYKALFPDALHLEGLRLLKLNGLLHSI